MGDYTGDHQVSHVVGMQCIRKIVHMVDAAAVNDRGAAIGRLFGNV